MKTNLTPLAAAVCGSLHWFIFPYYQKSYFQRNVLEAFSPGINECSWSSSFKPVQMNSMLCSCDGYAFWTGIRLNASETEIQKLWLRRTGGNEAAPPLLKMKEQNPLLSLPLGSNSPHPVWPVLWDPPFLCFDLFFWLPVSRVGRETQALQPCGSALLWGKSKWVEDMSLPKVCSSLVFLGIVLNFLVPGDEQLNFNTEGWRLCYGYYKTLITQHGKVVLSMVH